MNISEYQGYLDSFNGKDYDDVLAYWADDFSVHVQGELLFDSAPGLKNFYSFLHDHVTEEIIINSFLSDESRIFMEADVRITVNKSISEKVLKEREIKGIMPMEAGVTVDIPQFIHYHLENGKLKTAICLVSGPPKPVLEN